MIRNLDQVKCRPVWSWPPWHVLALLDLAFVHQSVTDQLNYTLDIKWKKSSLKIQLPGNDLFAKTYYLICVNEEELLN